MKNLKLYKTVQAALFAALTCVATMLIQIPVPSTGGYLNLGDAVILLGALLLGPAYGFAAGGLGSMLADLLSGYAQYVPGTLVIKGLCALTAALLWKKLQPLSLRSPLPVLAVACVSAELIMVIGYFVYEAFLLGYGLAAIAAVPGNLLQAGAGVLLAVPLFWQLKKRLTSASKA